MNSPEKTNVVRVFLCAAFWLLISSVVQAADPEVSARTKIDPPSDAWVGQAVNLDVEVLTTTWFRGATDFPTIRIPGCVVVVPTFSGGNFSERVGGETVSGIRRRYLVYPQRDGTFEIPALEVTATVADSSAQPIEVTVRTSPASFTVRRPAATEGLSSWVTTPRLRVTESYDPQPRDLKVGDSFTRTIRATADQTTSMMIPPVDLTAPEGVAVYPASPELDDRRDRGQSTATRVDGATYVLEREGSYELPSVDIHWWDPDADRIHTERLAALSLEVAPNPDLASEQWVSEAEPVEETEAEETAAEIGLDRRTAAAAAILAAVILCVGWLAGKFGPATVATFKQWRHNRQISETAYFGRFQRAVSSNDPAATLRTLTEWLDRAAPTGALPTVRGFAAASGDAELVVETEDLQDSLFGSTTGTAAWSASRLERSVRMARKRSHLSEESSSHNPLPDLNP